MNDIAFRILRKARLLFSNWSNRNLLLPRFPRRPREIAGDLIFVLLRLAARYGFAVAGLWGWLSFGLIGMVASVAAALALSFWIRYSLGLRAGHVMRAFRARMLERAFGDKPKLLEKLVEAIRGNELTTAKCAAIAGVWNTADSRLSASDSEEERQRVREQLETEIHRLVYRAKPAPAISATATNAVEPTTTYRVTN